MVLQYILKGLLSFGCLSGILLFAYSFYHFSFLEEDIHFRPPLHYLSSVHFLVLVAELTQRLDLVGLVPVLDTLVFFPHLCHVLLLETAGLAFQFLDVGPSLRGSSSGNVELTCCQEAGRERGGGWGALSTDLLVSEEGGSEKERRRKSVGFVMQDVGDLRLFHGLF